MNILEVIELSNIFTRFISWISGLFGGRKTENEPETEGHSSVYLPEEPRKDGRGRRDDARRQRKPFGNEQERRPQDKSDRQSRQNRTEKSKQERLPRQSQPEKPPKPKGKPPTYVKIMDWKKNKTIKFIDIVKKG